MKKAAKDEKVKTFVARIVQECEQEGLTVSEASVVPMMLRIEIERYISKIAETTRFTVRSRNVPPTSIRISPPKK